MPTVPRVNSPQAIGGQGARGSDSTAPTEHSPLLPTGGPNGAHRRKAKSMPALKSDSATNSASGSTTPKDVRAAAGTPQSRQDVALASLPARLERAASVAQKREEAERDRTQWQVLSVKARYYIPVRSRIHCPTLDCSLALGS